jgi:hypothetical protein
MDFFYNYFDKCVLINLDRRQDRWEQSQAKLAAIQWPFKPLERVRAIDGSKLQLPHWWPKHVGEGAFGCGRSHLRVLEDALQDGIKSILIVEDDFYLPRPETFTNDIERFITDVPDDWDGLLIGGQHMGAHGGVVVPGVVRCRDTQRTHCYAVRGRALGELYAIWTNYPDHIDHAFRQWMPTRNVYSPDPILVGQDEGKSDITRSNNPKKLWQKPKDNPPLYLFLNTPREKIEELRKVGFHGGFSRDARGIDTGLDSIYRELNARNRDTRMRKWVSDLDWESASTPLTATFIWHPGAEETYLRSLFGDRLVVMTDPTIDEAVASLKEHGGAAQ